MKPYLVITIGYTTVYLLRYNFKAAQPLMVEQLGLTTTDLGNIGVAFSIAYGISRLLLAMLFDGKNTKRILCALIIASSLLSTVIGFVLWTGGSLFGMLLVLWGFNGFIQSPCGPLCSSTLNRWTPPSRLGRFNGWWTASHNIGSAFAGILALWGAKTFFNGHVAGMFIVPAVVGIIIASIGLFIGKDDPQELGWDTPEEIFEETKIVGQDPQTVMTKGQVVMRYVIKNPVVWVLCLVNLFV